LQEVSWGEALGYIAARMKEIRRQHGPDSIEAAALAYGRARNRRRRRE
jgi:predicted molibdopterin-dependent oxidoreductase YjgC